MNLKHALKMREECREEYRLRKLRYDSSSTPRNREVMESAWKMKQYWELEVYSEEHALGLYN